MQKFNCCKEYNAKMDSSVKVRHHGRTAAKSKFGHVIGVFVLLAVIMAASGCSDVSSLESSAPTVVSQVTSESNDSTGSEIESKSNEEESSKNEESSQEAESEADSSETEETTNTVFHVGDVVDTGKALVTFKSVEDYTSDNMFIQPEEGNKLISAYFIIENKDKSDLYTGAFDFSCYADDSVCDSEIVTEKALSYDSISPGRKSEGYICFEVPEDAKKIEIEYEMSWWTQEKATFIVKE